MRVSLRKTNETLSSTYSPDYYFNNPLPLEQGEVAKLEFQFSPSATFFTKGDELRLLVQGKWFINSFRIHQVFDYEGNEKGNCIVRSSKKYPSNLLIPRIEKE